MPAVSDYASQVEPALRHKYYLLRLDCTMADSFPVAILVIDMGYRDTSDTDDDNRVISIRNLTLNSVTSLITTIARKYNNVLFQAFNYQEAFEEQSLNDEQAQAEYDYYEANGGVCDHDVARNKCMECNN
jgi:hypothetical protein